MIVRIIKSNDDGEVLEDKTYRQYTEKEWTKQMYKLRKNAIGHVESWSRIHHATFYTENEVLPMTERERARYKKKISEKRKQDRLKRKRKLEEEKARIEKEWQEELMTAWQWLSRAKRVPTETAKAQPVDYTDIGRWYYYKRMDTRPATDEEYERLKALYVEKFGGWEEIDLKNTTYDGQKWW